jgi:hypothetical protein
MSAARVEAMRLDLWGGNDSLVFSKQTYAGGTSLYDKYGDVSLMAGLLLCGVEAGFFVQKKEGSSPASETGTETETK